MNSNYSWLSAVSRVVTCARLFPPPRAWPRSVCAFGAGFRFPANIFRFFSARKRFLLKAENRNKIILVEIRLIRLFTSWLKSRGLYFFNKWLELFFDKTNSFRVFSCFSTFVDSWRNHTLGLNFILVFLVSLSLVRLRDSEILGSQK